ncbi:hypothetical protein IAG44_36075 [Streptomyces roseirectus]|uniref:Uncharacterized protein n=1 Tax=Streptomyces roseirectus TaxID=2768066 RepID=A0A7H0INI0_9ACTN|nr:DUF6059 family protein [Streptomyces roseirectus]QNP74346.1 hypothetical protein IAG44_36075 [Streptomyces roseirectus]
MRAQGSGREGRLSMVLRFLKSFVRELVRSAQVMGALAVGMSPAVLDEEREPAPSGEALDGLPGPGHPERPVPHVPPTPEERSLWSRLR